MNQYYVPTSTELVNVMNLNGLAFDPTVGQSFWSLKLQEDKKTLCASAYSQPFFTSDVGSSLFFRKVDSPPPINSSITPDTTYATSPVKMAQYIYNSLTSKIIISPKIRSYMIRIFALILPEKKFLKRC